MRGWCLVAPAERILNVTQNEGVPSNLEEIKELKDSSERQRKVEYI